MKLTRYWGRKSTIFAHDNEAEDNGPVISAHHGGSEMEIWQATRLVQRQEIKETHRSDPLARQCVTMIRVSPSPIGLCLFAILTLSAASAQVVPAPSAGDPKAGRDFALRNCSGCHVVSARQLTPPPNANAPGFKAVANMRSTTEMSLHAFLSTSHPKMPNFILTPNDQRDVIAYILSLRRRS